jgi:hypothetical protein
MTRQIETRGRRGFFGMLIMTVFLVWQAFMILWLFAAVSTETPAMKALSPEAQHGAVVTAVFMVLFIWSLSSLVLGTFVVWTRGPRIWTTGE